MGAYNTRLEEALELLDLGDWLLQYTEGKYAGEEELRILECPNCGNSKEKLYVNVNKKAWQCKVCEWGRGIGDPVVLMAAVSGRSLTDVRIELTKMIVPAIKELDDSEEKENKSEEVELPGSENFTAGVVGRRVHDYAISRGLDDQDIKNLSLRFSSSLEMKKKTGELVKITGPFLVFPLFYQGLPVAYQGRRLVDKEPKYISSSNIKEWCYPIDQTLFKVYRGGRLYVVEGVFDAYALIKAGIPAVCTFGKSLSNKQLSILQDLKVTELVFAWDDDADKEAFNTIDRVWSKFKEVKVALFGAHPSGIKVDPGKTLQDCGYLSWITEKLNEAIDVRSPEYFMLKNGR